MDVTFLGTNGWYDSVTGNTISTLVETDGYYILLDAGNGIHRADQFMKKDKPAHMFLSHFHLDHLAGLHILAKFTHARGLDIYGQPGTKQYLGGIMKHPYTIPFEELHYRAHVHELMEGSHEIPYRVECLPLIHADSCYGYRFEIDGKVLAYCTDTGYCENAVKLARGADLLITECSFKKGQSNPEWPHLSPEDAVRIAREAGAKKLALTHFDANNYRSLKERDLILEDHREVFIAHDCASLRV